jgi:hypothetical protein
MVETCQVLDGIGNNNGILPPENHTGVSGEGDDFTRIDLELLATQALIREATQTLRAAESGEASSDLKESGLVPSLGDVAIRSIDIDTFLPKRVVFRGRDVPQGGASMN